MIRNTTSSAFIELSADPISERAYAIYLERGGADGSDLEDWLQAERELGETPAVAPPRKISRRARKR